MHLWSQKGHWVTVIKCMSSGQIFPEKFVWSLSPHITGRKKIGGFQRLTSVLWWWLTAMGTRRKGGLGEEWDWRRLLFEGRESDSPESAGVWLCYSHCFLAWFESPLCVHRVTLVIASWTSWGERCRQVLSALRASVTAVMEGENEMPVCWCKAPLEEEETLLDAVFPLILRFLPYSSSLPGSVFQVAIAQKLKRLWIIVCILIRIYCFFPLKWTKPLPLGIS